MKNFSEVNGAGAMKPGDRALIVGGGISGCLLAWELRGRGVEGVVVDDPERAAASSAAGGLFSPISGMRLTPAWRYEEFFEVARETYRRLEVTLGVSVWRELPLIRLLREEEALRWARRREEAAAKKWVSSEWSGWKENQFIQHTGGAIQVEGGGWVVLSDLIERSKIVLSELGAWREGRVEPGEVTLLEDGVRWAGESFEWIFFCPGYERSLPWFDWLSWKPALGEILTVEMEGWPDSPIWQRGIFLLPLGENRVRCGATYVWDRFDGKPSAAGRGELEQSLRGLVKVPFRVVDHRAGVRPILRSGRPVLGLHPRYPRLGLMTGMASKGALWVPWCVRHWVDHLLLGRALDRAVDLAHAESF